MLTLWGAVERDKYRRPEPQPPRFWYVYALDRPDERIPSDRIRIVPLMPIWPGFAVNTLFYAAILWLLIPGPFALRRFIRRRRGLCPGCGYPVGEADVCSECGVELTP